MLSTQSALVLDALVDTARAGMQSTVEVVDGQPLEGQTSAPDMLMIGFSPNRVAVEVTQEESDLGANRDETLSIVCLASSLDGGTDMRPVRARAVQVLDQLREVLLEDPELGGAVASCELGFGMSLNQDQTVDGAMVTIEFTVLVTVL